MSFIRQDIFPHAIHSIRQDFLNIGRTVNRGEWQALRDDRPQTKTYEVHDISVKVQVGNDIEKWQHDTRPNLPWAEDHFQERVGGKPLNPGEQYKNWPWYEEGWEAQNSDGTFSHTYMERMWTEDNDYGTLEDLIILLNSRPYTRQAFHTIWWPNDTMNAKRGERVPCSLGYHFQALPRASEEPELKCTYYLRSCDYFRYLRDDVYMAGRLLQRVAEWVKMYPSWLTVHIANLHIFNDEVDRLKQEHQDEIARRMNHAF